MIRIEVEVETNDPAVRDYILGDVETWRRTTAKVSVSTREEDAWTGGAKTVHFSTSTSMTLGAVADGDVVEEEPGPAGRWEPPRLTTLDEARSEVEFPVFVVPTLALDGGRDAMVQPGGDGVPASVVVTHGVHDERGHHRGNVWVTSSAAPLPTSRFEFWRAVDGRDVCEDRSGGYYRCKVRVQMADASYLQVESTAHRTLDEVLEIVGTVRAE